MADRPSAPRAGTLTARPVTRTTVRVGWYLVDQDGHVRRVESKTPHHIKTRRWDANDREWWDTTTEWNVIKFDRQKFRRLKGDLECMEREPHSSCVDVHDDD